MDDNVILKCRFQGEQLRAESEVTIDEMGCPLFTLWTDSYSLRADWSGLGGGNRRQKRSGAAIGTGALNSQSEVSGERESCREEREGCVV